MGLAFNERAGAAQQAIVSIDGAMVYKGSTFDSPVIAYLKKGKQIRISDRAYGPFYRVQIRPGVIGYISDIDVQVLGKAGKSRSKRSDAEDEYEDDYGEEEGGDRWDEENEEDEDKPRRSRFRDNKKPIFMRRFVGGFGGILNFKEEILDQKVSSNVKTVGAKITGPNLLFEGPYIFDINLFAALGVPSYYAELSTTSPSGFIAGLDANLIFPFHVPANEKWTMYFGAGPVVIYSKFNISVTQQDGEDVALDLQDLKLGANLMAGFSYEIGKDYLLKVEPRFIFEKNSYLAFFASFQKEM